VPDEVGPVDVHAVLPHAAEAVASARRLVDGLHGHLEARVVAVARLLISEVATNAVKYASGDIDVRITGSEMLRFSITSQSGQHHQPHIADPSTESGLGLRLVDHLADDWGCRHEDGQTTVWFALAAPRSTPPESEP